MHSGVTPSLCLEPRPTRPHQNIIGEWAGSCRNRANKPHGQYEKTGSGEPEVATEPEGGHIRTGIEKIAEI
jgi:hypothetical protein